MRLVNSGEELLDLQESREDTENAEVENTAVVAERDDIDIDQAPIQSMLAENPGESIEKDQRTTIGKIDQRINKTQGHRGLIQKTGRKHKRVRYTVEESIK
ncbi:MAG TPA: hypothetical protein DCP62_02320 [Erysipelotrichaceae bacterium]|nr:hypothetical protein [Erysipelotrichaceae bacterium]